MVVNDSHRTCETKSTARFVTVIGVFRIANAAADDGIDVDGKLCVFRQKFEFLVQNLQTLHRNIVGLDVVDADLQVFQAGFVQRRDFLAASADSHW